MRILITGASGFVGRNLVPYLAAEGHELFALVRDQRKIPQAWSGLSNVHTIVSDLEGFLRNDENRDLNPELVFHFAWEGTSGALRADETVQLRNVSNTCALVRYAAACGVKRFVFAGSIMEYEAQQYVGGSGKAPGPASLYSTAKLTADYMAKAIACASGVEYVNVLISNIYGPGELSARFVNTMIMKLHRGEKCDLSEGVQTYDFIYISDAVRAIALAGIRGTNLGEYYIGNSTQRPLRNFVKEMHAIINPAAVLNFGAIPSAGPFLTYAEFNTNGLGEDLDFLPEVSFADGIAYTYQWLREVEKNEK